MLHYPVEDIIRLNYYFEEEKFDPKLIKSFINELNSDNFNIYIFSQDFTEEECNQIETIYGARYSL